MVSIKQSSVATIATKCEYSIVLNTSARPHTSDHILAVYVVGK